MEIRNLVIEVTRRCNMACKHCLRGEQENMDMKKEYIDSLLDQIDGYISEVTFTGGEPSLNVPIIEYFLNGVKKRNISLGGFYIATNGLNIKEDFIIVCLKLYSYCDEKDMCSVDISNDYYHEIEGSYDMGMLGGLYFVRRKYERDGYNYDNGIDVIRQGRGENIGIKNIRPQSFNGILYEEDFDDIIFYLNCEGQIINGCDWSYINQKDNVICNVENFKETYHKIINQTIEA